MRNKIIILCFTMLYMITIVSCTKSSSGSSSAGANTVSVAMMQFVPATITVTAGTTITWTNNDNIAHTVTSLTSIFDSGTLNPGGNFSFKFSTKGTYPYKCTIHANMTGTVIVN
jgi:plastocyanin